MSNPLKAIAERRSSSGGQGVSSSYQGAVSNRLTADWVLASIKSADQEVRGDLRTLRARARELARNNDTASRYLGLVEDNVVGHEGIRLQAQVRNMEGDQDEELNRQIERAWKRWGEPEQTTVDGRLGWVDVQKKAIRSVAQDGEALIRMVTGFRGNDFGFALHLLDPDQLDHTLNRDAGRGPRGERRNAIRMGVEVDSWNRPVAYHLWNHHPSEYGEPEKERVRVPADEIIHLYQGERVAQTRGITWFAPALYKLKMVDGYEEAELVASRMAAAKGGFFKKDPEGTDLDPNQESSEQRITMEMEPGLMDQLPPGWSFQPWDPEHPTSAFKSFHKAMVRGIANGLGVSYTTLANDLEDVNFSSIRAGLLNERDAWRSIQKWLIRHFHQRVYRAWLPWALTTGQLEAPLTDRSKLEDVRWLPRGWPWVDPIKDLQAAAMAVRLGLDSRQRLAGEQGRDFNEVLDDIAEEERMADRKGVDLTTDFSKGGDPEGGEEAKAGGADVDELVKVLEQRDRNGAGQHG